MKFNLELQLHGSMSLFAKSSKPNEVTIVYRRDYICASIVYMDNVLMNV